MNQEMPTNKPGMKPPRGVFITSTDTGVGKTWVSVGLIQALRIWGHSVAGMKPVASGCEITASVLRNKDALQLRQESSKRIPYALVNPYRFEPPIAPHLAAARIGCTISLTEICEAYEKITEMVDFVVVEGIGGWRVPLSKEHELSDMVKALGIPVLLVVGLRLGCINHALLSTSAIRDSGANLLGWIVVGVDANYSTKAETCEYLSEKIGEPPLAMIPNLSKLVPKTLAKYTMEVARLLQSRYLAEK